MKIRHHRKEKVFINTSHSLKTLIQCCPKENKLNGKKQHLRQKCRFYQACRIVCEIFTNRFKMDKHSQETNERRIMSLFQEKKNENIVVE